MSKFGPGVKARTPMIQGSGRSAAGSRGVDNRSRPEAEHRRGFGYLEAWLRGTRCVPLFKRMEDAATAEISRAQLWQWVHHRAKLENGRAVTVGLCEGYIDAELARAKEMVNAKRYRGYEQAATLMRDSVRDPRFCEFLALPAYRRVIDAEATAA